MRGGLVKYLFPALLSVHLADVLEILMRFLTLNLKVKFVTSESSVMRNLCGMLICNVIRIR